MTRVHAEHGAHTEISLSAKRTADMQILLLLLYGASFYAQRLRSGACVFARRLQRIVGHQPPLENFTDLHSDLTAST
jgi:microcystin degradation protein MlrC